MGISQYARDPEGTELQMLTTVASQLGATGFIDKEHPSWQRTASVTQRVLTSARAHTDLKIAELIETNQRIMIRKLQLEVEEDIRNPASASAKNPTPELKELAHAAEIRSHPRGSGVIRGDEASQRRRFLQKIQKETQMLDVDTGSDKHKELMNQLVLNELSRYHSNRSKDGQKVAAQGTGKKAAAQQKKHLPKLAVPQRLDLPRPLLPAIISESEEQAASDVAAILASHEVEYDSTMTKAKLEEMERELGQELQVWTDARKLLGRRWDLVMTNAGSPNAFVTNMAPFKIFVHIGLLHSLQPTDDELALILCHEISHSILGHADSHQKEAAAWQLLQLLASAAIGFDWFWVADMFLSTTSGALLADYSRTNETEADHLGSQLAARACIDVKKAAYVFKKLHEIEEKGMISAVGSSGKGEVVESTDPSKGHSIMASHPVTMDRYRQIQKWGNGLDKEDLNPACHNTKRRLGEVLHLPIWKFA